MSKKEDCSGVRFEIPKGKLRPSKILENKMAEKEDD